MAPKPPIDLKLARLVAGVVETLKKLAVIEGRLKDHTAWGETIPSKIQDPNGDRAYEHLFRIPDRNLAKYIGTYIGDAARPFSEWELKSSSRITRRLQLLQLDAIRSFLSDKTLYNDARIAKFPNASDWRLFFTRANEVLERRLIGVPREEECDFGIATKYRRRLDSLIAHYVAIDPVPFAGRTEELNKLDAWLGDESGSPRMLVVGKAGRGKTALLFEWIKRLHAQRRRKLDTRHVIFMPVSLRGQTFQSIHLFEGLALRLREIFGREIDRPAEADPMAYADLFAEEIIARTSAGERFLVVIDGVDELLYARFREQDLLPSRSRKSIKIIIGARYHLNDVSPDDWKRRLGWDAPTAQVEHLELQPLTVHDIIKVVRTFPGTQHILDGADVGLHLFQLTKGDPILLRLYLDALASPPGSSYHLESKDLPMLPPGIDGFFHQWMLQQSELERAEYPSSDIKQSRAALSILAFARSGLQDQDLIELLTEIYAIRDLASPADALLPIRRLLFGDGSAEFPYVLFHPQIADFLQRKQFAGSASRVERGYRAWGLRKCDERTARPTSGLPAYVVNFLHEHLRASDAGEEDWLKFAEQSWYEASASCDGTLELYAVSLRTAMSALGSRGTVGAPWKLALLLASLNALGARIKSSLLIELARRRVVSLLHAGRIALNKEDPADLAKAIIGLTDLPFISSEERGILISRAMTAVPPSSVAYISLSARAVGSAESSILVRRDGARIWSIITKTQEWHDDPVLCEIAHRIAPRYLEQTLAEIDGTSWRHVQTLEAIAPLVSVEYASRVSMILTGAVTRQYQLDACSAAVRIFKGKERDKWFLMLREYVRSAITKANLHFNERDDLTIRSAAMARHLSDADLELIQQDVASGIHGSENEAAEITLFAFRERIQPEAAKCLVRKIRNMPGGRGRCRLLAAVAPYISKQEVTTIVDLLRRHEDDERIAFVLRTCWDQKAIEEYVQVRHVNNRNPSFIELFAPYLSQTQMERELNAIHDIGDEPICLRLRHDLLSEHGVGKQRRTCSLEVHMPTSMAEQLISLLYKMREPGGDDARTQYLRLLNQLKDSCSAEESIEWDDVFDDELDEPLEIYIARAVSYLEGPYKKVVFDDMFECAEEDSDFADRLLLSIFPSAEGVIDAKQVRRLFGRIERYIQGERALSYIAVWMRFLTDEDRVTLVEMLDRQGASIRELFESTVPYYTMVERMKWMKRAKELRDRGNRADLASLLLDEESDEGHSDELVKAAAQVAATISRPAALRVLEAAIPVLRASGGEELCCELAQQLQVCSRRWR